MGDSVRAVQVPSCKAILMCRSVSTDPITGAFNLYGVIDCFGLSAFPGATFPFSVFLLLTGSQGEQELWAEVHDLRDMQVIHRSVGTVIPFDGRAEGIFVTLECPAVTLPQPGLYDLVVFSGAGEVDRLKFSAVRLEG
jgi:hypothetical protein